jgi:DNA topoisomerase-2
MADWLARKRKPHNPDVYSVQISVHQYVLLRPHEFIGSVQPVKEEMWVYEENLGMIQREIIYAPGLYKIFDSIIVNAADNKVRDPKMNVIKVYIDE